MRNLILKGWAVVAAAAAIALGAPYARALYLVDRSGKTPFSRETAEGYAWAEGVLDLANSPLREQAWHPIFSECPNDHVQFGYRLRSIEDANRLLQAAADAKAIHTVVALSPEREFRWNGETEGYEATFGLGSQKILDQWWHHLPGGRFGVHVYPAPPKAAPPLLTLYLGGSLRPAQLRLPAILKIMAVPAEEGKANAEQASVRKEIDRLLAGRAK